MEATEKGLNFHFLFGNSNKKETIHLDEFFNYLNQCHFDETWLSKNAKTKLRFQFYQSNADIFVNQCSQLA